MVVAEKVRWQEQAAVHVQGGVDCKEVVQVSRLDVEKDESALNRCALPNTRRKR